MLKFVMCHNWSENDLNREEMTPNFNAGANQTIWEDNFC